jgi:hypothetical protein
MPDMRNAFHVENLGRISNREIPVVSSYSLLARPNLIPASGVTG